MINVFQTDYEDLVVPSSIYNAALELSVNGNLNDKRTVAYRFLSGWANQPPKGRAVIERLVSHKADIESALLS